MEDILMGGFNSPNKGARIEFPDKPNEYFLVEHVESGVDPRGQKFWYAAVADKNEQRRKIGSDQVKSWKHFVGPNYKWHDEMLDRVKWEAKQKEQYKLVAAFEQKYKFPDGRTLRRVVISIRAGSPGDLGAFDGERMYIKDIDYEHETIRLAPINEDLADLSLSSVPAAVIAAYTDPALAPTVAARTVKLPEGTINMEQFLSMTPEFNKLVERGQVHARVQVYKNYGQDINDPMAEGCGEERYLNDMADLRFIPVGPNDASEEQEAHYVLNDAPPLNSKGNESLFGPWQASLKIDNPISQEAMMEIMRFTGKSPEQITTSSSGITVHSGPLYKNMVALGYFCQVNA